LTDLLEGHLNVKWVDDHSYLRILNIQMDVYELGGDILLSKRTIDLNTPQLSMVEKLKALSVNLLGVKGTCQLFRFLHTFRMG
jgi:hypothetical protein